MHTCYVLTKCHYACARYNPWLRKRPDWRPSVYACSQIEIDSSDVTDSEAESGGLLSAIAALVDRVLMPITPKKVELIKQPSAADVDAASEDGSLKAPGPGGGRKLLLVCVTKRVRVCGVGGCAFKSVKTCHT